MDTKLPQPGGNTAQKRPSRWLRQTILLCVAFIVGFSIYMIPTIPIPALTEYLTQPRAGKKVPLEAHIIAKCGNAKIALTELVLPTIELVHDKVDFSVSYIAKSLINGVVECKHGAEECEASIFELCAEELYPDPLTRGRFIECLTADFERIPERAFYEECAAQNFIDLEAVDRCVARDGGKYGEELLRESVQRSIDVGARISGTIRLNGDIYCIRDQGIWRECPHGANVETLVDAIEYLYETGTDL